jgi:uncharacterized membrane protein YhaH (DUF805 family)
MNYPPTIASSLRRGKDFSGRSDRSEWWDWQFLLIAAGLATDLVDRAVFRTHGVSPLDLLVILVLFPPSLAVSMRRLHDLDRTGWWVLIGFTGIGAILLAVWFCFRGTVGNNRFGPDPLAGMAGPDWYLPRAIIAGFRNYVSLWGRAAPYEWWYWWLLGFLVIALAGRIDRVVLGTQGLMILSLAASLVLLLPSITVSIRRLHDLDLSGWWFLIVPTGTGALILLAMYALRGTVGPNRYGPDPLDGARKPPLHGAGSGGPVPAAG